MKICLAQTRSIKGNIQSNISNHLNLILRAIKHNADLVVFPELSITNYEPVLAKSLATNSEDGIFSPFQELSDKFHIVISIGMPTVSNDGIKISMLIFQPHEGRKVYSKQMLHSDELSYFVSGSQSICLDIKGTRVAFGICYEALQRKHFVNAIENKADIYVASVAKSQKGVEEAYVYFPTIANEFETTIMMVNSIGYCDNFLSKGQSAIWNDSGNLKGQLNNENEGLLIYDTETQNIIID